MAGSVHPWTKIGRPTVLAAKFGKKLVSQPFRHPHTGAAVEYVLFGQRDWSVVLPMTDDGLIIAVEQYKQGCERIVLELPAGVAEFEDEDPRSLMQRELLEETGYAPGRVTSLGPAQFISTRNSWTKYHMFLATGCRKVQDPAPDANEEIAIRMVPIEEWIRLCMEELISPSSLATTFRALPHLGYRLAMT